MNSFASALLSFYRQTFKRVRPVHAGMHTLMSRLVIPLLERTSGLRTMPDDPVWFRLELLTGRHESETAAQLRALLRPGMTVLDVGAHVGYYTRLCARLVGPQGRVIAFEPHPRTHEVLRQNVAGLSNVTALPVALAEEEGQAELFDYLMMSASGSLHYDEQMLSLQKSTLSELDIAPRIRENFPVQRYSVRTAPVDALLPELAVARVDVVKMDIEGAEIGALRGMRATIAASPGLALVMEYNPAALQAFGHEPEAALREVLGLGFTRVQNITPQGGLQDLTGRDDEIAALTARLQQHMGVANLLFTR